ncbi:MAG: HpcH/HpaI aldolase/citrate lyase family protein [Methylovulum sp.]|nr:HpcH/HpaI aldolase/citrate lyase family protein [Methylovulum sp.]
MSTMTLGNGLHDPNFSPWQLGAPLYMPAYHLDLLKISRGEKLPTLRTMIFCTEDAIAANELERSLQTIALCLQQRTEQRQDCFRFIRVRTPEVLARILALPHIEHIDGFVLPKFNDAVFNAYFDQLKGTHFKVMPTLETKDVFDVGALAELRAALLQDNIVKHVLMLRIGGNDLMNLLGLRRPKGHTLYETPMGYLIAQLVTIFKPYGFHLSAPVCEFFADTATLIKEINLDLSYGLTGKTAIHPSQVSMIEAAYQVEREDYEIALHLTKKDVPAVFKMHNAMCEVATHYQWGQSILARKACYGVKMSPCSESCISV